MTDVYEFSEFDRRNLIYNYSAMIPAQVVDARDKYALWEKDQAAKKAAAVAAAKSAAPAPTPGTATPTQSTPKAVAVPQPQASDPKAGGST